MPVKYEWKMVERKRGDHMVSIGEILVAKSRKKKAKKRAKKSKKR